MSSLEIDSNLSAPCMKMLIVGFSSKQNKAATTLSVLVKDLGRMQQYLVYFLSYKFPLSLER